MTSSVEQLRWERRRKLAVREAFARGLSHFGASRMDPRDFYLACADYLEGAQRRLLDQDRRLVAILQARVPAASTADHAAMASLLDRLRVGEGALQAFAGAAALLRAGGSSAREPFEAAAREFIDVLANVLGARSHSLRHLTGTLLREEDWAAIADAGPQFIAKEARAWDAVAAASPPGVGPAWDG